ncbi:MULTISPECIES: NIPSNAP family protein [Pseudomonas]|jgi:predicted AlkP superfamily pyrophosphatase or phosphodiesterase|uniref:NIPSNAP family protein n=1 Tax=Pseudomonas fortuita TaxID=3233375 RepID=A0ACD4P0K0_9PSED|nr:MULTISPECIES: NIPSNAP family protein [Pseudomonas]ERT17543.1 NIPSNAP family containing protein [Pseudomonas putida SJ3]EKT4449049.1 NIPSNAP family protein [Pseudomonas putida]MCE0967075.1 NIPSNAP family protein [Pseudomonas sp. NMI4491_12]MDD2067992.1 NIPSNAP family protein [Pseudomonas putida]WAP61277.1 NIPSNAP family protein [Pseudomonas putida]
MDKAVVDHRIYTIRPRCMAAFIEAFDQLAMPILLRHLGAPLAFYTSSIGPLNQVVHLWGYDSLDDFEKRSAARDADPDFAAYLHATRDLVLAQETRILRPVSLHSLDRQ